LDKKGFHRYAEQVRASGLSMCNNIAEGSGSVTNRNFSRYLDYSRSSVFESANVVIILYFQSLISLSTKDELYLDLEELSRVITGFQRTL
jgi:four helix bundle protein